MNVLVAKACATIESARYYLQHLNPDTFQQQLPQFSGATIGQHTRHFVESFLCLLDQLSKGNELNYDHRLRNQEMESSPSYALHCIEDIVWRLPRLAAPKEIWLTSDVGFPVRFVSSFDRELLHNIEHTIHHLAIIRIGLFSIAPGIYLPDHFGVATSTIRYRTNKQLENQSAALQMAG